MRARAGVRVEIAALGGGAEDAFDRVVEQAVITPLGFAQRLGGLLALGHVLHQAFDRHHAAVHVEDADAPFPHATHAAVRVHQPILDVEAPVLLEARVDGVAHAAAVLGEGDVLVRHAAAQQVVGRVARQSLAAVTDELHAPERVVAAAVDHAVEVAEQRLEHAPDFLLAERAAAREVRRHSQAQRVAGRYSRWIGGGRVSCSQARAMARKDDSPAVVQAFVSMVRDHAMRASGLLHRTWQAVRHA